MNKEIFSNPEYNKELAICLHKMTSDNKSFAALRKARSEAFITQYMAEPKWTGRFKDKDMRSAADLLFPEWLKTVDVRDYFIDTRLLNKLLEEMSASEIKIILADEMRVYYDAFRKDVACSVFEEKENGDYDGDHSVKLKSDKNLTDFINELTSARRGDDDDGNVKDDERAKDDKDSELDEDEGEEVGEREDEDEDEDEDKNEDGDELGKAIGILVEELERLFGIECWFEKEEKKKNENKDN